MMKSIENDYYPYLMKYTEAAEDFGDRGNAENKLRLTGERKNSMIKAFHQDKETWLGSIVKLVWATNPKMKHLHNIVEDCRYERVSYSYYRYSRRR